jgi:sterol desaturase/sphingolipid hydroxylase (fatty acid hydroxylase superfamily)
MSRYPLQWYEWKVDIWYIDLWYQVLFAVLSVLCHQFVFEGVHDMLHSWKSIQNIHQKHHTLIRPVGLGALYSHPLEFVLANVIPAVSGFCVIAVIKRHVPSLPAVCVETICLFVATLAILGVFSHCGYDWTWDGGSHARHHGWVQKQKQNLSPAQL